MITDSDLPPQWEYADSTGNENIYHNYQVGRQIEMIVGYEAGYDSWFVELFDPETGMSLDDWAFDSQTDAENHATETMFFIRTLFAFANDTNTPETH